MKQIRKPATLSQYFRDIREKFRQKFLKQYGLPWMKSKELDILEEILLRLNPSNCFEWGSGYSTLYFPTILPDLKNWYSIEHHKEWYKEISEKIKDPRIHLQYVPPDNYAVRPIKKYTNEMEGTYEEFKTYIEFPSTLSKKLDFIFIDGRARPECLKKAFELIDEQGIVVLHDANRVNYRSNIPAFKSVVLFTDYRRVRGGMLIASKDRDIHSILQVDNHLKSWKGHEFIAQALFMR